MRRLRVAIVCAGLLATACGFARAQEPASGAGLAAVFASQVDKKLAVPPDERAAYAGRLEDALARARLSVLPPQYFVLVDRSPAVQAAFIYWRTPQGGWDFIGASPVSTGRPGAYGHFRTPLGVFEHTLANMDFRAEGTINENGVRGYGRKGMRVFDFGWVMGERGWGAHAQSPMRLQMHATDPDALERQLGEARSKGCIRIPATLDAFIDRYGLLDADYERAERQGETLWDLRPDREPTPWPGRYLVVVDSARKARPAWAPRPPAGRQSKRALATPAAAIACGRAKLG